MASLTVFLILGIYLVPSTNMVLITSPMISEYTLYNNVFDTYTTVTVEGFDPTSLTAYPPEGSRYYVSEIIVNGVIQESVCHISFSQLLGGGQIVMKVTIVSYNSGAI